MSREQAEAQVTIIAEMVVDRVAAKEDLTILRKDIERDILAMESRITLRIGVMIATSITIITAIFTWLR